MSGGAASDFGEFHVHIPTHPLCQIPNWHEGATCVWSRRSAPCPSCGAEMYLFRRSPEPGHHAYEVQIFSCMKCDAEITRSADRMGKPHLEGVLGLVRLLNIDATSIERSRTALPAPSMVNDGPINDALGCRLRQRGASVSK
jgi:hypothetical protein